MIQKYCARALSLTLLFGFAATVAMAQPAAVDGHWQGKIQVPGNPLEVDVDLVTGGDGALSGDISIPIQGIVDLALTDLARDGSDVRFKIPGIPGEPSFAGTLSADGTKIAGTFTQGGASLSFELVRGDDPAAVARAALDGFGDFVAAAVKDWNLPGAGVAVVAGGEVVLAEGFGYRDLESQVPMTADTLFAVGSTTKAFTTTALGMLVDQGKLDWDQPLHDYLPRFRLADPLTTELMTPRDLVTHRSGLPRHDLVWYNDNDGTRAELVARLAHLEASAPLRARFQYNNLMYLTAGHLIEELTGGSWEDAIRGHLLDPLGMERTTFSVDASQADADHALPYRENDDGELERIPFRRIDLMGPAGSINSSVREMSRWLLFNLGGGQIDGKRLINSSTLADIHTPQMVTGRSSSRPDVSAAAYGLGWMIDTYRGHRRVHHGGGIDGFTTSVMLFPDDRLGVVAFGNRGSGLPSILAQHAADRVLGLEAVDWNAEGLENRRLGKEAQEEGEAKKAAKRRDGTSPSHDLEEYAGDYEHPGYGRLAVAVADGALEVTYNDITTPLEHWHYDVFNGTETDDPTFEDMRFQFRSNVDGDVAAVEAPFEVMLGPIVFDKTSDPRLSDPEYLERFTGTYEMPGQIAEIELSGSVLVISLPGQPQYTLQPRLEGFVLAEMPAISIEFATDDDGHVVSVTFHQPNGVFEAKRKPSP
ncbi:MAG: serine hydrolase [Thermoanaerobaculia bacterium]